MSQTSNTSSQTRLPEDMQTRSKSGALKPVPEKSDDPGVIRGRPGPPKGSKIVKPRRVNKKRDSKQARLSGFFDQSKSTTTTKSADKEEVVEHKVITAVEETTYEDSQGETTVRQETHVNTTTVTTIESESSKKRKRIEDDDEDIRTASVVKLEPQAAQRPHRRSQTLVKSYAEVTSDPVPKDRGIPGRIITLKVPDLASIVGTVTTPLLDTAEVKDEDFLDGNDELGGEEEVEIDVEEEVEDDVEESAQVSTSEGKPKRIQRRYPVPPNGHVHEKYNFAFNFSQFPEHLGPSHKDARDVFELLQPDLANRGIIVGPGEKGTETTRPAHGSGKGVTVDAIVRTILSQATSNSNALFVQKLLREKYTYLVDGKAVVGKIPNYHKVLKVTPAELIQVIKPGGIYKARAEFILGVLGMLDKANETIAPGNPPNAADFVPGRLSMDFLEGKSKFDIMNWLLSVRGVGIKTACCILEFNYCFPVCAVDTHVHFMVAALGWIPEYAMKKQQADRTAMHLDERLPDDLKHDLHQAFWNHRQHCGPCKRAGGDKAQKGDNDKCVLGHMLHRHKITEERKKRPVPAETKATAEKTVKAKASKIVYKSMNAAKALRLGYVKSTVEMDDDFAAGSVNKKVEKIWVSKE